MTGWRLYLVAGLLVGVATCLVALGVDGLSALAMLVVVLAAMMAQWRAELLPKPPTLLPMSDVEASIRRERIYARAEKLATLDRLERYVQQRRVERDRK